MCLKIWHKSRFVPLTLSVACRWKGDIGGPENNRTRRSQYEFAYQDSGKRLRGSLETACVTTTKVAGAHAYCSDDARTSLLLPEQQRRAAASLDRKSTRLNS